MCGIVGAWGGALRPADLVKPAVRILSHRGPDDSGIWVEDSGAVALGHTRLAVLDLSPAGHQPMISECSRYVLVFNGEVYNHLDLRSELKDHVSGWRGHSDTETLLACVSAWGIERALKSAVGMFAFALWDRREHQLYLARDRFGEKPLYYGYVGAAFCFASELKAFRAMPGFEAEIERPAVAELLLRSHVPAPQCIYKGLEKLLPGTWLALSEGGLRERVRPQPRPYWSAVQIAIDGVAEPAACSESEAVDAMADMLSSAVQQQMVADVPLGVFLSGGIDSSTIAALMQSHSPRPIKTFTIGFAEEEYDEARHAKAVARHLGTEHTEWYLTPKDALGAIPDLPTIYDEPFADASQIPTYLVSKLARKHVTVALSGDGGDELFGGYRRYFLAARAWRWLKWMPRAWRGTAGQLMLRVSPETWDNLYQVVASVIPSNKRWLAAGDKLHKAASILGVAHTSDLHHELLRHWDLQSGVVNGQPSGGRLANELPHAFSTIERMMLADTLNYLPDDILVKVDRAAMAVSLETRVPLLDHRVFELAWRLPLRVKVRGGTGKWLLRQVLHRYVPRRLLDRPKMGFGVPIDRWLRGPLRDWAEDLLSVRQIAQDGILNPEPIRKKWADHLSGLRNWQYHLWDVLMFQAWLRGGATSCLRAA